MPSNPFRTLRRPAALPSLPHRAVACARAALSRHALALAALSLLLAVSAGCGHKSLTAPTAFTAAAASGPVQPIALTAPVASDEPVHLEGTIGPGSLWEIDKPAAWNGDLVVYLHGYSDPAQSVGLPNFGAIRDALVARGYAVAASSYSENGYAVKEGAEESHQLSGIFASRIGVPHRTFLFGQSLGALIGLLLAQRFPDQYDGGLLVCGVVGGSDDEVQYLGDIRVLFDAVYPGVLAGDLEHPPVITNLNAQVIGPVLAAVQANPQGVGIIQALARRPLPGANGQEIVMSLLNVLVFAMQGGGDLLDRTHGHTYFDNDDWRYTSPALPAALIDDINARVARYEATADAERFLAHYGEPGGNFEIPVVSLHTSRDPVVPAFHEDLLGQVSAGPWLLQRRVERYGHVQFSVAELMTNFESLVAWVDSGQKPAI